MARFHRQLVSALLVVAFLAAPVYSAQLSTPELKRIVSKLAGKIVWAKDAAPINGMGANAAYRATLTWIAKGGFGDIYRLKIQQGSDDGTLIAKVIRKESNAPNESKESIVSPKVEKAIRNLATFQNNEHFVKYFGLVPDKNDTVAILVEEGGLDLDKIYVKAKKKLLPFGTLFKQMADGLIFMHKLGYAHFDIKPANMLLGVDGVVRIIDTDDAEEVSKTKTPPIDVSSVGFTAPEVLNKGYRGLLGFSKEVDWRECDVHALGMSFLSLLEGKNSIELMIEVIPSLKKPYDDYLQDPKNEAKLKIFRAAASSAIAKSNFYKALPKSSLSNKTEIFKLIVRMLDPNPTKGHRPDILQVKTALDKIYP